MGAFLLTVDWAAHVLHLPVLLAAAVLLVASPWLRRSRRAERTTCWAFIAIGLLPTAGMALSWACYGFVDKTYILILLGIWMDGGWGLVLALVVACMVLWFRREDPAAGSPA